MPAVLGQAAPGGVVARLVAVPVRVLGPVVPDAVPRSDSSPCPCGGPRAGAGALVRVGLTDGGGEPVPVALLVRTAAPGRGLRPGRGIVGETHVGAGAVEGGLRPGRGIITRPARAGVEIVGRPARTSARGMISRVARRSREPGRSGAGWDGDRAHDDSRARGNCHHTKRRTPQAGRDRDRLA